MEICSPLVFDANGMDLAATLECGQTFGWRRTKENHFEGVAGQCAANIWQQNNTLYIQPLSLAAQNADFWRHYFALDEDYPTLLQRFCTHKKLAACVEPYAGVRVLHQPFFDTLLSFILSQNNHIPRITSLFQNLRLFYGTELAPGLYACPTPHSLAQKTLEELIPLKAGFRAKYLLDAAKKVDAGVVTEELLAPLPDAEARLLLQNIAGVGPKVADCVLLYSLGRKRVVPMDVWMKRAMATLFPHGMPRAAKGSEGIAQQYIFCAMRDKTLF